MRESSLFFQAILHNLWLDVNIKDAIDAKRIHHQLMPMQVDWEKEFPQVIYCSISLGLYAKERLTKIHFRLGSFGRFESSRA